MQKVGRAFVRPCLCPEKNAQYKTKVECRRSRTRLLFRIKSNPGAEAPSFGATAPPPLPHAPASIRRGAKAKKSSACVVALGFFAPHFSPI